jgi:hypothetical protein
LYAVDPAGVETSTPSHTNSFNLSLLLIVIFIFAACGLCLNNDISLIANALWYSPCYFLAHINNGLRQVLCAFCILSINFKSLKVFIKKPIYGMNCGTVGFLMNTFNDLKLIERIQKAHKTCLKPLLMCAKK